MAKQLADLGTDSLQGSDGDTPRAAFDKVNDNFNELYEIVISAKADGAKGDGVSIDTAALQSVLTNNDNVVFPAGTYQLDDELTLKDNQSVFMSPGVRINQTVDDKNIFKATTKDNVWLFINGGILFGKGTWSPSFTGNSGHEDRAIQFLGCTRSGIVKPVIKNCGSAGIAVFGGSRILIDSPIIEGTTGYTITVGAGDNFHGNAQPLAPSRPIPARVPQAGPVLSP